MRRTFGQISTSSQLQWQPASCNLGLIVSWCRGRLVVVIVGGIALLSATGCQTTSRSPFAVDQVEVSNAWRQAGLAGEDLECNYREGWRVGYSDGYEGTNKRHDAMKPAAFEAFLPEKRSIAHQDWHRGYRDGFCNARQNLVPCDTHSELFQGGGEPEPETALGPGFIHSEANSLAPESLAPESLAPESLAPESNAPGAPGGWQAPQPSQDEVLVLDLSDVAMGVKPNQTRFQLPIVHGAADGVDSSAFQSGLSVVEAEKRIVLPSIDMASDRPSRRRGSEGHAIVSARPMRAVPSRNQVAAPLALSGSALILPAGSDSLAISALTPLNLSPPVAANGLDLTRTEVSKREMPKREVPKWDVSNLDVSDLPTPNWTIAEQPNSLQSNEAALPVTQSTIEGSAAADFRKDSMPSVGAKVSFLASPDQKSTVAPATGLPEAMSPFVSDTQRACRQLPSRLPLKLRGK